MQISRNYNQNTQTSFQKAPAVHVTLGDLDKMLMSKQVDTFKKITDLENLPETEATNIHIDELYQEFVDLTLPNAMKKLGLSKK